MTLTDLRKDLHKLANSQKAKILAGFFKTGEGEYGNGDVFLGITVPQSRAIAHRFKNLPKDQIKQLFKSKIHEERLIAILLLVHNFEEGDEKKQKEIFEFYLKQIEHINNWDLVDLSADKIFGGYLIGKDKNILLKLAKSKNLWERRISIIATYSFIKFQKEYEWTFKIAEILLNDQYDLIQKAVGWMLREVGKNISQEIEQEFLNKYYKDMPRTTLRYAIERFPEATRKNYLAGRFLES